MERVKYSFLQICLLTTMILFTSVASGVSTRQVFGAPEDNGKISRLDLQTREVVVGDTLFKLSSDVSVYTYRGFETTVESLKRGMLIAFDISQDATGSPSLSVIWILSKKLKH